MNHEDKEFVSLSYPWGDIQTIHIVCKNYRVRITPSAGEAITLQYFNNQFRSLNVRQGSSGLYLEDSMKVTYYGVLRAMELMEGNLLEIGIPADCEGLRFLIETGVTEIEIDAIAAQSIRAVSASGPILIRDVSIGKELYAQSTSGRVSCALPGTVADYDVDCRADRMDVRQPYYPVNHGAEKKLVLRTSIYVPELVFTGV